MVCVSSPAKVGSLTNDKDYYFLLKGHYPNGETMNSPVIIGPPQRVNIDGAVTDLVVEDWGKRNSGCKATITFIFNRHIHGWSSPEVSFKT